MTTTPAFALHGSRLFAPWLDAAGASLAFTTYQAGKLFMLGLDAERRFSVYERTFDRPMGLGYRDGVLWLATRTQLVRLQNFATEGRSAQGYDAHFVPLAAYTTGDVDVHDITVGADGAPAFVVTRFNSLARLADGWSFAPFWRPSFIDRLAGEDRCHLNGLACDAAGTPRYATAVAATNVAEAWRDRRRDGGIVIDVASGEIVATGLSMPHSPRLYGGQLWLLNAGTGDFGRVDLATGRFEPVAFCPGFLRGLAFVGEHAVVAISKMRENRTFGGLALDDRLRADGIEAKCGLRVIDFATGDVAHSLEIEGVVQELYDVAILDGIKRPALLGWQSPELANHLRLPQDQKSVAAPSF